MAAGELSFAIRAVNEAKAALQSVQSDIDNLGNSANRAEPHTSRLGSALANVGQIAGGIISAHLLEGMGSRIIGIGQSSIALASSTNESLSKVRVVFGDAAGGIEAFARTSATSLGTARGATLEAAGTFGNLFVAMGLGKQDAADLSRNILTLGTDLASFNNIDPAEALEKLRSGLVGESEPLRSLGVNLNEAAVKAKAMEMGLAGADGQLTESAKVQARYALIMEQTKTAQGDFARTSDGLANQQRILNAQWDDAKTKMGTLLLPALTAVVTTINSQVIPAINAFASEAGPKIQQFFSDVKTWWDANGQPALDNIMAAWKALQPVIQPVLDQVQTMVETAFKVIGGVLQVIVDLLGGDFSGAWNHTKELIETVVTSWKTTLTNIWAEIKGLATLAMEAGKALLQGLWDGVTEIWTTLNGWLGGVPQRILDAIGDLSRLLYNAGKALIQGFIDGITSMIGTLTDLLGSITDKIPHLKGPIEFDRQMLVPNGQAVMDGFIGGISSRVPALVATLGMVTNLMGSIPGAPPGTPGQWYPMPGASPVPGWEWDPLNGAWRPPGGGPATPIDFIPPEFRPVPRDPWAGWKEKDPGYAAPGRNVTINVSLPNYLGDKGEIVDVLERELRLRFA